MWVGMTVFSVPELRGSPSKVLNKSANPTVGQIQFALKNKNKETKNPDKCSAKMSGPGITGS